MATGTNLSAEEPSERASTGPRLLRVTGKIKVSAPDGSSVEAGGEMAAPSGGGIETAFAIAIVIAAAVLLPAAAVAILAAAGVAGGLIGVIACGMLVICLTTGGIVINRKGWLKS